MWTRIAHLSRLLPVVYAAVALLLANHGGAQTLPAPATHPTEAVAPAVPGWAKNWPQFRGPSGDGRAADDADPPARFDLAKHTRFSTVLPDRGRSSPILWADRIYLTGDNTSVMALDRTTGKLRWNCKLPAPTSAIDPDKKDENAKATGCAVPTPVTDGHFVYAFFANGMLACVDSEGRKIWARQIIDGGPKNSYGLAASPVLWDDLLIQVVDCGSEPSDNGSFVVAVRAKDGTQVWRKERAVSSSWTTPAILRGPGGDVIVTTAPPLIIAYDPRTGDERWHAKGSSDSELSTSPMPCADGVIVLAAADGLSAFKAGAKDDQSKSGRLWASEVPLPRVSSPAGGNGRCYLAADGGLTCVDTANGKQVWDLDLDGDFWASPVVAKDRIYAISRNGTLFVVSTAGKKLDTVRLNADVQATPAIAEGCIYIRTSDKLLCLGSP